ncbi:MAG TPA: type II secretion system F family protein [Propionibacterium sp.]|nr:type II secretion system F family protein [Propionibacterium sp.]
MMTQLAAFFAGLAVFLAVPRASGRWTRPPSRAVPQWLRPRDDALAARTRWLLGAGSGLVAYLLAEPLGFFAYAVGASVAVGAAVVLGRIEPPAAQQAREQRVRDLPEALDLLEACLGSGLPLRRAVREVAAVTPGPIGQDLASVVSLVDVGVSERAAWMSVADRPGWETVGKDIARAADRGTGLRTALARHATRARRTAQAARQARARTLGVRSVWPLMVCFLPAFVLLGIVPTVGSMVLRVLRFN